MDEESQSQSSTPAARLVEHGALGAPPRHERVWAVGGLRHRETGWSRVGWQGGGGYGGFFLNSSSKNRSFHYLPIQSWEDERVYFFILI